MYAKKFHLQIITDKLIASDRTYGAGAPMFILYSVWITGTGNCAITGYQSPHDPGSYGKCQEATGCEKQDTFGYDGSVNRKT